MIDIRTLDILEVEPGVFSILRDGQVFEARVDGDTLTVANRRYPIEQTDSRKWNPSGPGVQSSGRTTVKSPMPGKIIRILAAVGDDVAAGQGLIVVEAMKMQNELKAARPGRVTSIAVQENDTVEAGAVLVVVE